MPALPTLPNPELCCCTSAHLHTVLHSCDIMLYCCTTLYCFTVVLIYCTVVLKGGTPLDDTLMDLETQAELIAMGITSPVTKESAGAYCLVRSCLAWSVQILPCPFRFCLVCSDPAQLVQAARSWSRPCMMFECDVGAVGAGMQAVRAYCCTVVLQVHASMSSLHDSWLTSWSLPCPRCDSHHRSHLYCITAVL